MKTKVSQSRSIWKPILFTVIFFVIAWFLDTFVEENLSINIVAPALLLYLAVCAIVGYVRFIKANPSIRKMRRNEELKEKENA